ncbi:MAG: AAA family ATPase [Desulfosoma sp.]
MKILRLRFKNISSLRGEWDIRFDAPPFSDTGLFAITGPNGSGKSSILDAITLGLYGQTVRLRHPEQDITSWLEDESYAEVTFQVSDKIYRSRWWARKSSNGLLGPEMSLSSVNGTEAILENRILGVRSRLSEITGLDFKRFCRSVLLAQGEFAAFLNALEHERSEILEMIMGPEVTQDLAQDLDHRLSAARERLLQLKELAANYPPVDREARRELEIQREEKRAELEDLRRQIGELEAAKERLETLERLHEELRQSQELLSNAEAEDHAAQEELQRMETLLAAQAVLDSLRHYVTLETTRNELQSRLETLRRKSDGEKKQLQEIQGLLAAAEASLEAERQKLAENRQILEEASRKERDIQRHVQKLQEASARSMELERARKDMLARRDQIQSNLEQAGLQAESLQKQLTENASDAALENHMPKLQELLKHLETLRQEEALQAARLLETQESLKKAAAALEKAQSREHWMEAKIGQAVLKKEALEQELKEILGDNTPTSLKENIKERKKTLAAYRKLLSISQRFHQQGLAFDIPAKREEVTTRQQDVQASLNEALAELRKHEADIAWRESFERVSSERSKLQEGSPCPLCGSLTHPFVTEGLPDLSQIYGRIDALQDRIVSLRAELTDLNLRSAQLEKQAEAAQNLLGEWQEVCRRAGLSLAMVEPNVVAETIQGLEEDLRHDKAALRSSRWKRWRLQWVKWKLHRRMQGFSDRKQQRRQLEEKFREKQAATSKNQQDLQRVRGDLQAVSSDLQTLLNSYGERFPEKGEETLLLQRRQRRREAYERAVHEHKDLLNRKRSFQTQLESLALDLARLEKEAEEAASHVDTLQSILAAMKEEREAIYAGPDATAELQSMEESVHRLRRNVEELQQQSETLQQSLVSTAQELSALASELESQDKTCNTLRTDLETELKKIGLDSLEAAASALKAVEEESAVRQRAFEASQNLARARGLVDAAAQAISEVSKDDADVDLSAQEIADRISQLQTFREKAQRDLQELESRLDRIRQSVQEHRELLQAVEDQERLVAQLSAEAKAFRDEKNAEAREKIRRIMLERLMEQANTHLELLSGRYRLRPLQNNGFGLAVEDLMQQRNQRSLRTLSGGETFVVSLSLALGLSDLAAHHRRIESLFLDEGFGALDEESLYRVITALRRLQANGKMVGVISHVKRLAEEIETQIRVEQEPGGRSRIMVVP